MKNKIKLQENIWLSNIHDFRNIENSELEKTFCMHEIPTQIIEESLKNLIVLVECKILFKRPQYNNSRMTKLFSVPHHNVVSGVVLILVVILYNP